MHASDGWTTGRKLQRTMLFYAIIGGQQEMINLILSQHLKDDKACECGEWFPLVLEFDDFAMARQLSYAPREAKPDFKYTAIAQQFLTCTTIHIPILGSKA